MGGPVLLALSLLSVCISGTSGGKVLVVPVEGSHWVNMKIIIEELHSRGHSITVVRPSDSWYIKEDSPHYTAITIPTGNSDSAGEEFINSLVIEQLNITIKEKQIGRREMQQATGVIKAFNDMHRDICAMMSTMFTDEALMQSLQEAKYDLVLTDPVIASGVFLSHHLQLPLVFSARSTLYGDLHSLIGPSPLSYVPAFGSRLTDRMSFSERLFSCFILVLGKHFANQMTEPHLSEFSRRYLGPDVDLKSLFQNADLWLVRYDFNFEFPRPTMPNVVYIGGFQCKPARPLPVDLEAFVQSSEEHGVIIMSLGTLVAHLPSDTTEEIAAAFAQLPQKVIWRYKGSKPSTLGNNTLLVDWLPQNDLLGHPKTKVFIAHGGMNGVQEAIYHGVPILGLPLMFDQPDNLFKMEARGTAKVVELATLDRSALVEALKEVLYEPSYRENMQRLSRIHRDQPMKPLDRAIFWIEFVMRNGGAPHLRTQSFRMSWVAYHSIDVILTLLMALIISLLIMGLAVKKCFSVLFRKKVKSE